MKHGVHAVLANDFPEMQCIMCFRQL